MLLPRRLFHLRPRFTLLFHCGSFSPLCCDPALSVFASKCQGVECHAVKAARCGSWLGGSLVSALSLVASHTLKWPMVISSWSCCCFVYGPANMTHKLSYARAEMITITFRLNRSVSPINWNLPRHGFVALWLLFFCVVFVCCLCWFWCFCFGLVLCFSVLVFRFLNPGT